MNETLCTALNLLIWAFLPVTARVLLQWATDRETKIHCGKGVALFLGSLAFGAGAGMLCGLFSPIRDMREMTAATAGFVAQDAFLLYLAGAQYYRKHPRAAWQAVIRFILRKEKKK